MNWTKELPKEDGFYWYRPKPTDEPRVAKWTTADGCLMVVGLDFVLHADSEVWGVSGWTPAISGEFWPEKLQPPKP